MKSIYLFFIFLSGIIAPLTAKAADNYYFRHYTNKDGLSHNTVYCSMQDSRGFMWFGTEDGLNRFDGHTFSVFRFNASTAGSGGLPNDRTNCLFEDSKGRIWVCTNGGICYYTYETNSFHPLIIPGKNDLSSQTFSMVKEDAEGNLWFRSEATIIRYNPNNQTFKIYTPDETGFYPTQIGMSNKGQPFFSDAHALYLFKPETEQFARYPVLTEEERRKQTTILQLCEVPNVGILIGTNREGLKLYHTKTNQTETLIPDIYVRFIMHDQANTYWIASESGIYIYNILDRSVVNLRKSLVNEYTISDNAVYSLTKDREGGIWAGTFFGGINYLPNRNTSFRYYLAEKTHPGMLGNAVREICPDRYGNLWIGTEDNGINRYDPQTDEMVNYSLRHATRKLSATNIHGLYAKGDTLWIGTFNTGIDLLHIPTGKIVKRYTRANTHNSLSSDFILCFQETSRGEWLIGASNGVFLYDQQKDRFTRWQNIHVLTRQIMEDSRGDMWVATSSGIYRYIRSEDKIRAYRSEATPAKGLGSDNTTSVFEDSHKRIWITTAYGFSLYHPEEDDFTHFTVSDGLPSNVIYRIVEDDFGLFWITTANGLVRFHPETYAIRTYSHFDGLHEAQFNYSSSYKAKDGTIYLGTVNGMISFDPRTFREDSFTAPLYIKEIAIPEREREREGKQYLLDAQSTIKLPYNHSAFTISFIAPSFTSPQSIQYAYKLDGADTDWVTLGNTREVAFAGLSPGKYTFRVKSTNSSNLWQDNEQHIPITITPPFWATIWAYIFYTGLVIAAIITLYRHKQKRLIARQKEKQELFEKEKEKELYHAKVQYSTFIKEEIRTPLNLIKEPLEKILLENEGNEKIKQNLRIIERNTERLFNLSNLSALDDIFLQKLNTYIEENLTNEALNVETLAQEMGMSNSSLYRKVKAISDLTPIDLIRMARLRKALELMQSGDMRINEIAFQAGFSSPAYFSNCFQKEYGKSPSEFMKEKLFVP